MALNNSSSKACHGFSKSDRFPPLKQNTKNISHSVFNKTSDFDRTKNFGATAYAFGSNARRFQEFRSMERHSKQPDPSTYQTQPRTFSPDVSRSKGWSVGLGRDTMQKIHIDRLNDEAKKSIASPCPGSYEKDPTFGKQGTHFSIRKKLTRYGNKVDQFDTHYFDSQKKLPGPGSYVHAETVGARISSSTMVTAKNFSIPKAQDRFKAPTIPKVQPSPNQYAPKADIVQHVKSNHPRVAMTKFGLNNSSILDQNWGKKMAETTPGPGAYGRWSDFTKDVK